MWSKPLHQHDYIEWIINNSLFFFLGLPLVVEIILHVWFLLHLCVFLCCVLLCYKSKLLSLFCVSIPPSTLLYSASLPSPPLSSPLLSTPILSYPILLSPPLPSPLLPSPPLPSPPLPSPLLSSPPLSSPLLSSPLLIKRYNKNQSLCQCICCRTLIRDTSHINIIGN